ncbi:MAG: rhodanese-related sulfurtransferase [Pseudomonadota bacterium]
MPNIVVAALYKFTPIADIAAAKAFLDRGLADTDVRGTILIAEEGVNGTIAGSRAGIDAALALLARIDGVDPLEHKESFTDENPFLRLKVRLKKEIVTMGAPEADPNKCVGDYVEPEDWNALITSDDVVVIDTRNDYEVAIGTFDGAIDPHTTTFREFPAWFREFQRQKPNAKIAMFCTGGIRCEKATSFVKQEGIEDVFHLKGGILKYLERVPEEESLWRGECFVFDNRVSVKHGLEVGDYDMCHACRRPIDDEDKTSAVYLKGVSCPHCHDETNAEQRERFAERQKQIDLARARGEAHLGAVRAHHVRDGAATDAS